MNISNEIKKLSKLFFRLGYASLILMWVELILTFIPKYQSLGQTIYYQYGEGIVALYYGSYLFATGFFFSMNKRVNDIEERIEFEKEEKKNKTRATFEQKLIAYNKIAEWNKNRKKLDKD